MASLLTIPEVVFVLFEMLKLKWCTVRACSRIDSLSSAVQFESTSFSNHHFPSYHPIRINR